MKALKLEMGDATSTGGKLILKTAKGTRDYEPHMMAVREKVLEKVSCHVASIPNPDPKILKWILSKVT